MLSAFSKHGSYRNKYVEKIIYNTEKEEFTFTKRNFLGFKYNYIASRFKILYTENVFLNRAGTNYFDIDTKEEFSIAYRESWVKQDLFSHLIAQRIKVWMWLFLIWYRLFLIDTGSQAVTKYKSSGLNNRACHVVLFSEFLLVLEGDIGVLGNSQLFLLFFIGSFGIFEVDFAGIDGSYHLLQASAH